MRNSTLEMCSGSWVLTSDDAISVSFLAVIFFVPFVILAQLFRITTSNAFSGYSGHCDSGERLLVLALMRLLGSRELFIFFWTDWRAVPYKTCPQKRPTFCAISKTTCLCWEDSGILFLILFINPNPADKCMCGLFEAFEVNSSIVGVLLHITAWLFFPSQFALLL